MESKKLECAKCAVKDKACRTPEGQGPAFCPTLHRKPVIAKALEGIRQAPDRSICS